MCGRYFLDLKALEAAEGLCDRRHPRVSEWRSGDIHPADWAPVLVADGNYVELRFQKWGFPGFDGKGLIFNARAETALEKKLFAERVFYTRAAIPASAFYEWDARKQKWTFRRGDEKTLYLGGFWRRDRDAERFVILTTAPNESMKPVHDRMPLILEQEEVKAWLCTASFRGMLSKKCAELRRDTEYEQMSLF